MRLRVSELGEGPPLVLLHGLFGAAQNFGGVQRSLAGRFRTIALDLRNHGASPHAAEMTYPVMANDVVETLRVLDALPCALLGHSMGGKVAMRLALDHPDAVSRLVVSDIAPVAYPPAFVPYAAAMDALPLLPGLTRAQADAALSPAIPDPGIRAFLLQNLRLGEAPAWRIGLREIAASLSALEGWESPSGKTYDRATLFLTGARSDYVRTRDRPIIRALFPAARFVAVKDAGHWVHADNPAGFLGVLEAFLGMAEPPSSMQ